MHLRWPLFVLVELDCFDGIGQKFLLAVRTVQCFNQGVGEYSPSAASDICVARLHAYIN